MKRNESAFAKVSGDFTAVSGVGVTVVELDKDGKAVSVGYLASATSKTS